MLGSLRPFTCIYWERHELLGAAPAQSCVDSCCNPSLSINVENHLNFTPCNQTPLALNPIEKAPDDNKALESFVTYGPTALCSPGAYFWTWTLTWLWIKFPGYFALSVGFYLIRGLGNTQLRPQLPLASVHSADITKETVSKPKRTTVEYKKRGASFSSNSTRLFICCGGCAQGEGQTTTRRS